jgi:predicted DNA-binding transcriptional regulator YafY
MAQIRFQPEVLERVRLEHHWGLVEQTPAPEGIVVTLLTHSLEWLAGWVLSFGSKAEALGPDRFRHLVATEAQQLAAQYAPLSGLPPVAVNGKRPRVARVA